MCQSSSLSTGCGSVRCVSLLVFLVDCPDSTIVTAAPSTQVMSQQTQIDRVKEYWQRWIAKWPTVKDLAVADEEAVNQVEHW